ncbi:alpha/beta hydrolase [bacterium]|nr:alpha/beta hydrolase [bacterium]
MKKGWKIALIALAALLVLIFVGPFLVPVPPLEGTVPVRELAGPEGDFVEINGLDVYYQRSGKGDPTFILLHGFGASTFSWREVIEPLAEIGMVIAYDRPAFGLTERPLEWDGVNPYSQQGNLDLLLGLMDAFSVDRAILVGNSAGGTLATAFTLAYPERVAALIEVDAAIYQTMPDSPLLTWLLQTPQLDHLGPLIARRLAGRQGEEFIRNAWYDPARLEADPEIMAGYRLPLRAENWDEAFWAHTQASAAPDLAGRLDQITVPTLVITGDNDRIVPPENSRQLSADIPGASLVVLENCGHLPQEECPAEFIDSIAHFMTSYKEVIDE